MREEGKGQNLLLPGVPKALARPRPHKALVGCAANPLILAGAGSRAEDIYIGSGAHHGSYSLAAAGRHTPKEKPGVGGWG